MITYTSSDDVVYAFVTIQEKATSGDYYLFSVEKEQSNKVVSAVVEPHIETDRYTVFELDPSNFNATAEGMYKYTIYQQDDEVNTDPDLTNGVLERGKIFVTQGTSITAFGDDGDSEIKAFEG